MVENVQDPMISKTLKEQHHIAKTAGIQSKDPTLPCKEMSLHYALKVSKVAILYPQKCIQSGI